jgi:hypothetical protein
VSERLQAITLPNRCAAGRTTSPRPATPGTARPCLIDYKALTLGISAFDIRGTF